MNMLKWLTTQPDFEAHQRMLEKRFGHQPAEFDVLWSLLNFNRIKHSSENNFGLYRNDTLHMGDLLSREGRHETALKLYFEKSYLDANGATNRGGIAADLLMEFPVFDLSILAPLVVPDIFDAAGQCSLDLDDLEPIFVKHVSVMHRTFRMPVDPRAAWNSVRIALDAYRTFSVKRIKLKRFH